MLNKYKYLLFQMVKRDFREKYKGSALGIIWSVIVPIFMMIIYTFVFSVIFQVRWSEQETGKFEYALMIFCGLCAINMINEVMNRASMGIVHNANYVKKVIFPLEIIPLTITITAFFNAMIQFIILIIANVILTHKLYVTNIELVLLVVPLFVMCLGIAYFLAAFAVYFRDIINAISVVNIIILYISPVFYSINNIPTAFRVFVGINPFSYIIENSRRICLYGENLNWTYYGISLLWAVILLVIGLFVFRRMKVGFADVL